VILCVDVATPATLMYFPEPVVWSLTGAMAPAVADTARTVPTATVLAAVLVNANVPLVMYVTGWPTDAPFNATPTTDALVVFVVSASFTAYESVESRYTRFPAAMFAELVPVAIP
jgi:hypothetical protein